MHVSAYCGHYQVFILKYGGSALYALYAIKHYHHSFG